MHAQSVDAVLHLGPLPSGAEEGEPVGLYGWLSGADGYAVPDATICVKGDVELGSDEAIAILTTGADGAFSAAWTGAAAVRRLLGLLRRVRGEPGLRKSRSDTYSAEVAGIVSVPQPPEPPQPPSADDSGCLIATAAHGTELVPQVQALREYRDGTPLATGSGSASMSAFSAAYYSFSPHVADLEREHPAFRQAVSALIAPMLHALSVAALADPGSEASVAAHGVAAILLAAGMYAGAPAGAAAVVLRWRRRPGRRSCDLQP